MSNMSFINNYCMSYGSLIRNNYAMEVNYYYVLVTRNCRIYVMPIELCSTNTALLKSLIVRRIIKILLTKFDSTEAAFSHKCQRLYSS